MSENNDSNTVRIGNVTGGIHGSIIAGRDVRNATITLNGQLVPAEKQPTVQELQQLLVEIQRELAEIASQEAVLKEISPATTYAAKGAEQSVKDATERIEPEMKPEAAKSVQQRLSESITLLSTILDGAKTLTEKTKDAIAVMQPFIEKLTPLITKMSVAVFWVEKLWLLVT